ncbi:MAG: DUF721 domain-containing protein [Opitutales bacterium]|nr:DUF721 domain-containing protein [Opitutales bacterium]
MPLLNNDSDGVLSSFRCLPNGRNQSMPPQPPQAGIDKILASLDLGGQSPIQAVLAAWNDIVPPRFKELCEPSDIGLNALYVRVFNSAAKQELMFAEREILRKVKSLDGCSKIKKIKFL